MSLLQIYIYAYSIWRSGKFSWLIKQNFVVKGLQLIYFAMEKPKFTLLKAIKEFPQLKEEIKINIFFYLDNLNQLPILHESRKVVPYHHLSSNSPIIDILLFQTTNFFHLFFLLASTILFHLTKFQLTLTISLSHLFRKIRY